MTITRTLQNASAETEESVNIKPFDRDGWVKVSETKPNTNRQPQAYVEYRMSGDDPAYPLVNTREIRDASVYHPAHSPSTAVKGKAYTNVIHTTVRVYDDVSGREEFVPVSIKIEIAHGGPVILLPTDTLDLGLSTVAELWDSVTTGDVDTSAVSRLALGDVQF